MSLLDDARNVVALGPCYVESIKPYEISCRYCGERPPTIHSDHPGRSPIPHDTDCPWLAMPQIIAALEAVDGILKDEIISGCSDSCSAWVINQLRAAMRTTSRSGLTERPSH